MSLIGNAVEKELKPRTIQFPPVRLAVERRGDGTVILTSEQPLDPYEAQVGIRFRHASEDVPRRIFLAERQAGRGWVRLNYAEARAAVGALSQALLDRGLDSTRPVMILSGNSIAHALLTLAAMQVGIPVAPVSQAYALLSQDHAKLKAMAALIRPGLVFFEDAARFAPARAALDSLGLDDLRFVARHNLPEDGQVEAWDDYLATAPGPAVETAFKLVGPDSVAKYLFTSGSTGTPKAVINTQRMMCANQKMVALAQADAEHEPPVLLDWLPWSHTYGGNHNLNYVFWHKGTLHIDAGRPLPDQIEETVRNLREIAPTVYFSVPAGYAMLLSYLEDDPMLARNFFRRLKMLAYGGAAMPEEIRERLMRLAEKIAKRKIPVVTGWGATETAPTATSVFWHDALPGVIGLPLAGVSIKMVPVADSAAGASGADDGRMELRVKGPLVTPGYYGDPALTRRAFDEEGYYRMGDAGRLADPGDPEKGIRFEGRLAENFKLATGSWVAAGAVRLAALGALAPLLQDALVAGHDRPFIGLLAWPDLAACRALTGETDTAAVCAHARLADRLKQGLAAYNARQSGASSRIARLLLLATPPSLDAGEITDKGYINQAAGLRHRAQDVARLYAEPPDAAVILL